MRINTGMIDENQLQELRKGMEIQFRYKFYKEAQFPFLQSLGIKHILQAFDAGDDIGFIGMLHLWWVSDPTGTVTGIWESEWFNTPQEGVALAQKIDQDLRKIYNIEKLEQTQMQYIHSMAEKEMMKQLQDKIRKEEEEESKTVLWN